jgi:WD40 repeat protein
VFRLAFTPNGRQVVSAGEDGTAKVWSLPDGAEVARLRQTGPVTSVATSGDLYVTGALDGVVRIWAPRNSLVGALTRLLRGDEGEARVKRARLRGHHDAVTDVAVSPQGDRLASASLDGTVRIWDLRSFREASCLDEASFDGLQVMGLSFSPDGRRLAAGMGHRQLSRFGYIQVWEVGTGRSAVQISIGCGAVMAVAFSPDGKHILAGSRNQTVRLFDSAGGAVVTLRDHERSITCLAISPDGRFVATGAKAKSPPTVYNHQQRIGQSCPPNAHVAS